MTETTKQPISFRPRPWFHRHRIMTLVLVNLVILTGAAVLMEIAYRGQWIDFHRADLAASNPTGALEESSRPTVLALGDSFTAGRDNWPGYLQKLLGPEVRVVNSGVGGSTIRQMRAMIEGRIRRFQPRWVICQIYTGNDLSDLRHPKATGEIGPLRRLYWLANDLGAMSPWFLNTRLRLAADRLAPAYRLPPTERRRLIREMEARPFSVEDYSPRSRTLLAADPTLISDQIALTGEMAAAWSDYRENLVKLIESCTSSGAELILMVVPHCSQVSPVYARRFEMLGARFPDVTLLEAAEYPFVVRLRETAAEYPGVEVLNVLPPLRSTESSGGPLFFPNDPHLNPTGRRVVAGIIINEWKPR
jgi:GDSL-like Lipase/Acylhydrolase family